jgi:hypothetical protein
LACTSATSSSFTLSSPPALISENFVLISTILRTLRTTHLGRLSGGDLAPYLAWAREGIGTRRWD